MVGGAGGIYIFLYLLNYLITEMKLGSLSSDATFLIYICVFIVSYACVAGFISVLASYLFVESIYKTVKDKDEDESKQT